MDKRSSDDGRVLIAFHEELGRKMKERGLVVCVKPPTNPTLAPDPLLLKLTAKLFVSDAGYPEDVFDYTWVSSRKGAWGLDDSKLGKSLEQRTSQRYYFHRWVQVGSEGDSAT